MPSVSRRGSLVAVTIAALSISLAACGGGGDSDDSTADAGGAGSGAATTAKSTAAGGQVCAYVSLERVNALLNGGAKMAVPSVNSNRPGVAIDACTYKVVADAHTRSASISVTRWASVDQAKVEMPRLLFKPEPFAGLGDEALKGNDGNGGAGAAARFGSITIDVDLGSYSKLADDLDKVEAFIRAVVPDLQPLLK